jgi:spore maturation protein CgeB
LFKALHESGDEVIVIPYLGDPVESLWWRTYANPCSVESKIYNWYLERKQTRKTLSQHTAKTDSLLNRYTEKYIRTRWEKHLVTVLDKEKNVDAVLFINIPLNHIKGIASAIKKEYSVPVAYFDGDMPTILPHYAVDRGFKFNYYTNADLSEYDAFFSNSKGVIPDLKELGARNIHTLYYAADPELFKPVNIDKTIDISFYGHGSELREEWMKRLITGPSLSLADRSFSVGGKGFDISLGNARMAGYLSYSEFRRFCCQSRICLNITRSSHASVYASSTARPFELAAFGACMVSQPYNGIEEWFEIGKEVVIADSGQEVVPLYQELLDDDEKRRKIGERARLRMVKDHTYTKRAETIHSVLETVHP